MRIILLFSLLIFSACAEKDDAPEDLLDRDTFKEVLTEAHIIEARMNQELVVAKRKEIPMDQYYAEAFATHGTDRDQFQRTFEYYSSRPAELRKVYEEILTELSRRKDLVPDPEDVSPEGQVLSEE